MCCKMWEDSDVYHYIILIINKLYQIIGGRYEIRTHEELAPLPVFKTGAFNRSANLPDLNPYDLLGRYFTTWRQSALESTGG